MKRLRPFASAWLRLGLMLLTASPVVAAENTDGNAWDVFGQSTYILSRKNPFSAPYTDLNGTPNSLSPEKERSFTFSATVFAARRLSQTTELYFVPEIISLLPLSQLHGLGGSVQDGELEKGGTEEPTLYRSRLFVRYTRNLGGERTEIDSAPMQMARSVESRRFVLTAGNFAVIDIFDKNAFAGDVRQQFVSMNFLTYSAYDFEADARGYTWGVAGEYYHDDWALRFGRFVGPKNPNQLPLDDRFWKHYGDQLEIEHAHKLHGQPGKIRMLAYRNVANMGRWDDAVNAFLADPGKNATTCTGFNYGSSNPAAPDLCWARKRNSKVGAGIDLEQSVTSEAGVFLRAMKSDGHTEVYAFTSTDSSLAFGTLIKGRSWHRAGDSVGVAFARNWISNEHAQYLALGGVDGFIGDGALNRKPESAFEVFYNLNVNKYFWITSDYQHIENPAYNGDRGPVNVYAVRLHAEF